MHGIDRLSAGHSHWAVPRHEADLAQSYVFQSPILLRRSALDNVAYPLIVHGLARGIARRKAMELIGEVGLGDAAGRPAHVLSGGEKQKLALARALVTRPQVLFLDEPTASLDGRATREIEGILTAVRLAGTKIVMATHDLGQARRIASDILFLLNGKVHESGPASGFFSAPTTPEAQAFLKGDIVE
jgi:tungstate transport system ATP-binding protein